MPTGFDCEIDLPEIHVEGLGRHLLGQAERSKKILEEIKIREQEILMTEPKVIDVKGANRYKRKKKIRDSFPSGKEYFCYSNSITAVKYTDDEETIKDLRGLIGYTPPIGREANRCIVDAPKQVMRTELSLTTDKKGRLKISGRLKQESSAFIGDYVCKDNAGKIFVCSDSKFKKLYRACQA